MVKDLLMGAQRQYRHNNSDGFVCGYDMDDTEKVVGELLARIEHLENGLIDFKTQYRNSPWIHRKVDEALCV